PFPYTTRFRSQHNEKNDPDIVIPFLADNDGFLDFGQLFDLTVNLGGANANTTGVQRCIGSAIDDHTTIVIKFDIIAVTPDVIKAIEIGIFVTRTIRIVPEANWHGREGRGTDQFALFVTNWLSVIIKNINGKAERTGLDDTPLDRQDRTGKHKTSENIRAPRD